MLKSVKKSVYYLNKYQDKLRDPLKVHDLVISHL